MRSGSGGPDNGYGPVAGSHDARAAAAGWFARRGLPTDPDQIVLAPGQQGAAVGAAVGAARAMSSFRRRRGSATPRRRRSRASAYGACRSPPTARAACPTRPRLRRRSRAAARQGAPPGRARAHAPRQPDRYRAERRRGAPHGRDRRCARPQPHLGRDLPRSRARARRGAEPRRVAARAHVCHERAEQEHGARRLADRLCPDARELSRARRARGAARARQRGVVERARRRCSTSPRTS